MTHDELLEKIDEEGKDIYANFALIAALRGVVELHKPIQSYLFDDEVCESCSSKEDYSEIIYPCPTIQVIQEHLK